MDTNSTQPAALFTPNVSAQNRLLTPHHQKIERDEHRPSVEIAELLAYHLQIPEAEQDSFIRRARGEFVAQFGSPVEMSLAEAQAPAATEQEAPKHNLPAQTTSFVGREAELADITKQLNNPNCRLLTILGAGGMGKTRLGIAIAADQLEQFTDGLAYVALAPISRATSPEAMNPIVGALADALQISFHGEDTPEQQLFAFLRRKEMLLVFDNFEHLLETAVFLSHLLAHAPTSSSSSPPASGSTCKRSGSLPYKDWPIQKRKRVRFSFLPSEPSR